MSTNHLKLKGAPGSPYTRKMLAYLRYRHIPYQLLIGDQADQMGLPKPKVELLPTFYLPNNEGDLEAVVDSTPLIRRFESEFSGRAVVPDQPALAFLDYLLEDYGDEWLTKPMFHYRWYYSPDIEKAGKILPRWRAQQTPDEDIAKMEKFISERQISRLYVVGSNDVTAPVIEASYRRFLGILDRMLQNKPFVLGDRPSATDLAFYAQLTQLAKFDPTPAAICLKESPRVFAWVDIVDDLSGVADETSWIDVSDVKEHLHDLLAEVGRTYVPALFANAEAIDRGDSRMETTIDGKPWEQPVFPYQAKCLLSIRQEFARLDQLDQDLVKAVLADTGCEQLVG